MLRSGGFRWRLRRSVEGPVQSPYAADALNGVRWGPCKTAALHWPDSLDDAVIGSGVNVESKGVIVPENLADEVTHSERTPVRTMPLGVPGVQVGLQRYRIFVSTGKGSLNLLPDYLRKQVLRPCSVDKGFPVGNPHQMTWRWLLEGVELLILRVRYEAVYWWKVVRHQ
jgi:hypothetical protein